MRSSSNSKYDPEAAISPEGSDCKVFRVTLQQSSLMVRFRRGAKAESWSDDTMSLQETVTNLGGATRTNPMLSMCISTAYEEERFKRILKAWFDLSVALRAQTDSKETLSPDAQEMF
eukprot:CAMPEP_0169271150 /NCGR_PEP_ID=MMETSP1016-20121227/49568_1 /TAXON_ID=342587 /ORGANISM="Karlodinium micrum, Strain CCMP2283" /LENGTH=116 /DNA_ID=CAMNT_0009356685 /DNA_START=245 /DNA_END=592 /DNA_ORIENTATION=+